MSNNKPPSRKPSLLTLANRSSNATTSENALSQKADQQTRSVFGQSGEADSATSNNSIWKAWRARNEKPTHARSDQDAIASIERDVDALIGNAQAEQYAHPYGDHAAFKPLIDPFIIASAIWRWRWPIIATTFIGGVAGVMIALGTPHVYTAYSQVLIDPRQVKLVERDLTPEFLGNESAMAIVDSQLESVYSTPVLLRVIDKLKLDQNSEFNGSDDKGIGLFDGIAFVRSLFSDETPTDTNSRRTVENLRDAVDAGRNSSTFVFWIAADSQSPQLAADIANSVTQSFIENQIEREATAARTASNALGGQLVKLKTAVENAERKAELFAQANNLARVEGLTLTDSQLVATSAQLSEAKAATIRAKSIAEAAQSASVDAVVSGALPPELVNTSLSTFRAQFSSLSQNAAALEQALGPKHPRLATAIAARESARAEIAAELQRIIAGTQSDLRRAIRNEQQIAASLAETRAEKGQSGEALITLRELEGEIEVAQSVYKAALLRSQETNQLESLVSVNATIISKAEPPLYASSLSRKFIAASGAFAGFMIGLSAAFISGLRDCVQTFKNGSRRNQSPIGGSTVASRRQGFGEGATEHAPPAMPQRASTSVVDGYPEAAYQPYAHTPQHHEDMRSYSDAYMQHAHSAYAEEPMPQQMYAPPELRHDEDEFALSYEEEREMEELRASVQDIREVLDHLKQTRSARRRFG